MLKYLKPVLILVVSYLLWGCGESNSLSEIEGDGMVNIVLSVATVDSESSGRSRADEYYFEEPSSQFERLRSLRYIFVRPDGTVEYNIYIDTNIPESGVDYYNSVKFKVRGGEKKKVYVIGNEASVRDIYNFDNIKVGSIFPTSDVESIILRSPSPAFPLFDNSDETSAKYLPMAEQFEIDVVKPSGNATTDTYQYETLFLTRTTVKFSISAKVEPVSNSNIVLKRVTFKQIGDRQYLFPNNTAYSPEKYPVSGDNRIITAYDIPSGAVNSPVSFDINWTFPPMSAEGKIASPPIYFPETKLVADDKYSVRVVVAIDGEDFEYDADLPNLPSLPRNTHVRLNLVFTGHNVECHVDVAPYIGVELKPSFGFDKLHPNLPDNN